jgi:transcriptional regulator with XRE-family HTH domain
MVNYGEYLKILRESNGLTLREVEKRTEISNAYLSQLEAGKIKQPSPIFLHKLAQIYQVSYETLMEKVGYPVPQGLERKTDSSSLSSRMGNISDDEEKELLDYLKFIRSRRK